MADFYTTCSKCGLAIEKDEQLNDWIHRPNSDKNRYYSCDMATRGGPFIGYATPWKPGTRVKIIDANSGANGANGKTGVVMPSEAQSTNGNVGHEPKVRLDNGQIWAVGPICKLVEIKEVQSPTNPIGLAAVDVYEQRKAADLQDRRRPNATGAPTRNTTLPTDAAGRKTFPIASGFLDYFPDAVAAVANLSFKANEQHNPGQPVHWARGKSNDHADTLMRHFLQRGTLDTDGQRHSVKIAWRALALLQEELEQEQAQQATAPVVGGGGSRFERQLGEIRLPLGVRTSPTLPTPQDQRSACR